VRRSLNTVDVLRPTSLYNRVLRAIIHHSADCCEIHCPVPWCYFFSRRHVLTYLLTDQCGRGCPRICSFDVPLAVNNDRAIYIAPLTGRCGVMVTALDLRLLSWLRVRLPAILLLDIGLALTKQNRLLSRCMDSSHYLGPTDGCFQLSDMCNKFILQSFGGGLYTPRPP